MLDSLKNSVTNKILLTFITVSMALSLFDVITSAKAIELLTTDPQNYAISIAKIAFGQKVLSPFMIIFNTKLPSFDILDIIPISIVLSVLWIFDKIKNIETKNKLILSLIFIPVSIILFKYISYFLFISGMQSVGYTSTEAIDYLNNLPESEDKCIGFVCFNPLILNSISLIYITILFVKVVFFG
jgi:hypothetical protein